MSGRLEANSILEANVAEVVRFVINGVVATLVHYSVFYSFYRVLGVPSAALGNALGAACGITSSFIGSRYFVFPKRRRHLGRELECFLALYAAIALVNAVVMLLWTDVGRLNYNVGFTLAVVLQAVLAFLGNRYLVFNARGRMP